MISKSDNEIETQRGYYARTAHRYDEMHVHEKGEHFFALSFMTAVLEFLDIKSILDIGSGTGRTLIYIKKQRPDISIVGVEPVGKLRDIGYSKGILKTELIEGDATSVQFQDGEFDLVCAFGVLHHIKYPQQAVSEMLRVSKKAIFISDSNNFGQGPGLIRLTKQIINLLRLWKFVDFIKTKGKGYALSEGDGLAYSYSVFNNYSQIRHKCKSVHIFNTIDAKINPYRTSGHIALLGIKQP